MSALYGPFPVHTFSPEGEITETLASGVHYTTDVGSYEANASVLAAYRVRPVHPLQFVLAGDDPTNPQWTVALVFPDQATADATLAILSTNESIP